jgi:hypothetical protein
VTSALAKSSFNGKHVLLTSIGNLGYLGQEEQARQQKHEDDDGQVHPLHVLKGTLVAKVEEDVGAENRGNDGSNAVESL